MNQKELPKNFLKKSAQKRLVKRSKLKKSAIAKLESRIFRGDDNKYYEQIAHNTKEISEEIPFDIPILWRWCRIEKQSFILIPRTSRRMILRQLRPYGRPLSPDMGQVSHPNDQVEEA